MLNPRTPDRDRTQFLLAFARHRLLATDLPQILRVTAFLRLSCSVLDDPEAYSHLLEQLAAYPGWWLTCSVTPATTLTSSDPAIADLFAPINHLHQLNHLPQSARIPAVI